MSQPYLDGSLYGLLDRYGYLVIREDDFRSPAAHGRPPHDQVMHSKLVL